MSENPFVGTWSLKNANRLGSLGEIKIERQPGTQGFRITGSNPSLHLPDLDYDAEGEILIGRCEGTVGSIHGSFNVAVVQCGPTPGSCCKGIIFYPASKDREDNSVGTWTADKKGDPPPDTTY